MTKLMITENAPTDFQTYQNTARIAEIKLFIRFVIVWMAFPIVLSFWMADLLYVPQFKWEFLALRALIIPAGLITIYFSKKARSFRHLQALAAVTAILISNQINFMIYRINDPATPYAIGLILVAIAGFAFVPWSWGFGAFVVLGTYLPYFAIVVPQIQSHADLVRIELNCFFIVTGTIMSYFIRVFSDRLRQSELESRFALDRVVRSKIEETKVLQQEVRQNYHITKLARQASHDIRSPVSALNLVIQSLNEIPEHRKSFLLEASSRVNDIANELLQIARGSPASGISPDDFEARAHISVLAEKVLDEKKVLLGNQNIKMVLDCAADSVNLTCGADPSRLKRILSNAIQNSIEAIKDHGEIRVSIKRHVKGIAIVEIKDNGKGVPPNILPSLMVEGFSYDKKHGNGLGLYMAKQDIEKWGGSIELFSKENVGTRLEIRLPIKG